MGRRRKKKRVYLGTRVPDEKKPGLDTVREVLRIVRAIMLDYRLGRINKTLAKRRLNLLKLAVMRDRDFQEEPKRSKALGYIDRALEELKRPKRGRGWMGIQDELFEYYEQKILSILKKIARTARTREDLCRELKILRSTISGLGGAQLSKQQKDALRALIDEALRKAGCLRCAYFLLL